MGWTSILRAGIFREEEGRGPVEEAGFPGVGVSGIQYEHRHPFVHLRGIPVGPFSLLESAGASVCD